MAENEQPEELKLSPSERIGYQAATNLSGGARNGSTQRALASIVLGFELVIIFLIGLALFGLQVFAPAEIGLVAGAALCLLCILALALMRKPAGIWLGWAVQALLVIAGFWLPAIWLVALMFGGLWVYCIFKGGQIDRQRAEYFKNNSN